MIPTAFGRNLLYNRWHPEPFRSSGILYNDANMGNRGITTPFIICTEKVRPATAPNQVPTWLNKDYNNIHETWQGENSVDFD